MDNLFLPIDGVIVKLIEEENTVIELSEDAKSRNIGTIISTGGIMRTDLTKGLTKEEDKQDFLSRFKLDVKIRFTEGYVLNDLGKNIYYVKLENVIGIYS